MFSHTLRLVFIFVCLPLMVPAADSTDPPKLLGEPAVTANASGSEVPPLQDVTATPRLVTSDSANGTVSALLDAEGDNNLTDTLVPAAQTEVVTGEAVKAPDDVAAAAEEAAGEAAKKSAARWLRSELSAVLMLLPFGIGLVF